MLVVPIIAKQEAEGGSNKSQLRLILTSLCLHLAQGTIGYSGCRVGWHKSRAQESKLGVENCGDDFLSLRIWDHLGWKRPLRSPDPTINLALPTFRVTSSLLNPCRDKSRKELWRDGGWISENTWDCFRLQFLWGTAPFSSRMFDLWGMTLPGDLREIEFWHQLIQAHFWPQTTQLTSWHLNFPTKVRKHCREFVEIKSNYQCIDKMMKA